MNPRIRSRNERTKQTRRFLAVSCLAAVLGAFMTGDTARAEERKYGVMLAHSPKAFVSGDEPGLPPGGLHSTAEIKKDYFDRIRPDIDSFAEYWEEISYGDIVITGDVFGWVTIPWAFEPDAPNAPERPSPADFVDLQVTPTTACTLPTESVPPIPYAYGSGEQFCDCQAIGGINVEIEPDMCGALIITDLIGNLSIRPEEPRRRRGMPDAAVVGVNVWTPGERFIDLDNDNRWDGIDEKNDMMCHNDEPLTGGCRGICSGLVCSDRSGYCVTDADCSPPAYCKRGTLFPRRGCTTDGDCDTSPNPTETCGDTPWCLDGSGSCPTGICASGAYCLLTGPRGCDWPGCGDLTTPCVDWNSDDACVNDDANCRFLPLVPCIVDTDCAIDFACRIRFVAGTGICIPIPQPGNEKTTPVTNCWPTIPGLIPTLPECCAPGLDTGTDSPLEQCRTDGGVVLCRDYPDETCDPRGEGIACGEMIPCCEYSDVDVDGNTNVVDPFEDFIIRYEPSGSSPGTVWAPVSRDYIRNNYPGDVNALLARDGNGYYNSPDLFHDVGNTKMMQDAGNNRFAWRTPKPGTRYSGAPNNETAWFDGWWSDRYGSTAPSWPGGSGSSPSFNSPIMRPFDPDEPVPPIARGTPGRRWFRANRGGWTGFGRGSAEDAQAAYDIGGDAWDQDVLPEEGFGYYDGLVEHDDLASSWYHHAGDKRLGEITSPSQDRVTVPGTDDGQGNEAEYTAIFGVDLGENDPFGGAHTTDPDNFCVAAGPRAVNIHGEKGFDAGDVCILEWLTWRTNGTSPTITGASPSYHPFARTVGFRDYNLDGMIDQGEVRPELSENYSVDPNPFTIPDDGFNTNYPFNRRRVVEDVVEALDSTVDWDDFAVGNRVSGIVLVPPGAFTDPSLFPYAPSYYTIHTEDRPSTRFHDLVTCQDCQEFPSALTYSAHEYLHTWENFPDLYDYGVFDDVQIDAINCPIGRFCIMAGGDTGSEFDVGGGLVHPVPILKSRPRWIDPVNLQSVLTPGVETTLTLPPAEFVRDDSYFYLANSERPGERFYFWSAGSGFDERFPGEGMLVLRSTDFTANQEALANQQRTEPYNFLIIQADANGDLEACAGTGNTGDAGDFWPGSTNADQFNFNTDPSATWNTQNRWTGLDISNIQPDGAGSVRLTLSWVPTNIPSLRFIDPPGGESVGSTYQVRYEATDVYGGTTIQLFYTAEDSGTALPSASTPIGSRKKNSPGTVRQSIDWWIGGVPDGRYFVFAKLTPGAGADGTERSFTAPRAGRNNRGNGSLSNETVDANSARSEAWTIICIDQDGQEWRVNSSLTQPEPSDPTEDPYPHAFTCPAGATCTPYSSIGGEIEFVINEGSVPFKLDDTFTFSTTGITALSKGVTVLGGRISGSPTPVINASKLSGRPPLTVDFDARDSTDPEGQPLSYRWDFGDGTSSTGPTVSHTFQVAGIFTVVLRATDPFGRFGEATVDIHAINNSPTAVISADPTSGPAPLTVRFDGSGSTDTETLAQRLIYRWDFGDGKSANQQGLPGILVTTDHFYSADADGNECTANDPCMLTATLTVTDSEDRPGAKSDSATIEIMVGNSNPVPNISVSRTSGSDPLAVVFNAINSTDPEGHDVEVLWKWGDGKQDGPYPLTGPPGVTNGDVVHEYRLTGGQVRQPFNPTAILTDGRGGRTEWSGPTITVTEPVPGASNPFAKFTIEPAGTLLLDQEFTVDASLSFDRPTNDPNARIESYTWDFGDETAAQTGITATHAYTAAGTYTITLVVTDPDGNFGRAEETVQVTEELPPIPPVEDNRAPVAVITINPSEGFEGVTEFSFDASGSSDPDGDDITFVWAFGDGSSPMAAATATHVYARPGVYVVRLTVRDVFNATTDVTQSVVVLSNVGNQNPVALIGTGRRSGPAPLTITFDGRISYDPNGDDLDFAWEFRQGQTLLDTLTGSVVTRVFADEGTYSVELIVDDRRGGIDHSARENLQVTARFVPPDPGTDVPLPPDEPPPGSHEQRPGGGGMCGLGMVMTLCGSWIGLTLMRVARRRFRL